VTIPLVQTGLHKLRQAGAALRSGTGKNVATVFGGSIFSSVIGFVTTVILVRHLAPAEYGVLPVLDLLINVSAGLLVPGVNWLMIKSVAGSLEAARASGIARRVLEVEIAYGLVIAAVLYVGAPFLATHVLRHPETVAYVRLSGIGVLGSILFAYRRALFQALKRFGTDARFTIAQAAMYLIAVAGLVVAGMLHIKPLVIVYVSVPLLVSMVALRSVRQELVVGGVGSRGAILRGMAPASGLLSWYTLCLWIVSQVHIFAITRLFSLSDVGVYGFAYKIYLVACMAMSAAQVVLLPTFASLKDTTTLRLSFHRALRAMSWASLAWWATIPFIGLLVYYVAGHRYLGATPVLQVFMVGAATSTMLSGASSVLVALGRYSDLALSGTMALTVNIIGHVVVTPRYGVVGAAGVQVVSFLVNNLYNAFAAHAQLRARHALAQ
jgi:O-antigen/teichoic acid export membrane protein